MRWSWRCVDCPNMNETPLFFLHGWGLHGGIWAETVASVPGLTPELPGYGESTMVRPYTIEALADALAATLPDAADICGWSLGGMVALALAARHPHKVSRLILVATNPAFVSRADWPYGLAPEVLAEFARSLNQDYKATLSRFLSLQARGGDQARAVVERLRASVLQRDEPSPESLAAGLELLRDVDLRDRVEQVRCPTLVVHGAYDMLCPIDAARWLAESLPDARLAAHERAAHAPFLSHPAWFVSELKRFLQP